MQQSRSVRTARWSSLAAGLLALLSACASPKPHPPPEGEWLEWQPESERTQAASGADGRVEPKRADDAEDLDEPPPKAKDVPPTVRCRGRDTTRESLCLPLSELGGASCPSKLPNRPSNKQAGIFEVPPRAAKRDPSLERSGGQCCYAWCGIIPSASPPVPCNGPEPLFCFEAPVSTAQAAPPPYAECPMGLAANKAKKRRKSSPKAAFSSALTKAKRRGEPKACCYQTCM